MSSREIVDAREDGARQRLEDAQAELHAAEADHGQRLQFAFGNGGRQGDAGRRRSAQRLERARSALRAAEAEVRSGAGACDLGTVVRAAAPGARRRTILFVHSSDDLYGSDGILLALVRGLDPKRFRCVVALPVDGPQPGLLGDALLADGVRVHRLSLAVMRRQYFRPLGLPVFTARLLRSTGALRRLMAAEGVDLVHSHTAAVVPGALAAKLSRRPHVWQTLEIVNRPALLRRTLATLLPRLSRAVVAGSEAVRAHLAASGMAEPGAVRVLRYGIDAAPFVAASPEGGEALRRAWNCARDDVLVGVLGRVHPWKGQESFLRSAASALGRCPRLRCVVVGDVAPGNDDLRVRLAALAAELGLGERVVFTGFRRDVPDVLAACDVVVVPSTAPDPFPTVVLEAMAASRPVVAFAHGGCTEMVVSEVTGLLVPVGDEDGLAAAILRLADDADLRGRLGAAGRRRVQEEFTRERFIASFTALYEELLPAARP